MADESNKHLTLAERIFGQLAKQIVTGEVEPGERLPPERTMAEHFGVTRHVVREAVKRLQQAGLVQVVHGGGTRVLDIREHAGLDLLELMVPHIEFGPQMYEYWRSILEMRVVVAADMARMCTERAPRELKDELLRIVEQMRAAPDDDAMLDLDERFWTQISIGAENLAYRLSFNTLRKVSTIVREVSAMWMARELRENDFGSAIAEAISAGDPERAERVTRTLMQTSVYAIEALYEPQLAAEPRRQSA